MPDDSTSAETFLRDRILRSFQRQGPMRHLGAELVDVRPGQVTIHLPTRDQLTQQHGHVHTGAVSTIADTAGGHAALTLLDADSEVLPVEYKINLLAPARGDRIEATGTVLRSGRTLTECRLDAWAVNGDQRTAVAAGQQTLIRTSATNH